MCGIAGLVDPALPEEEIARLVGSMVATLHHRGPDDSGHLATPGFGFGVRRLSIIDVAGGRQPVENEDGSVVVVQNGEIYNYRALRHDLAATGHRLRTQSDTEVIVHAYEEGGPSAVERLSGMFGLAIWDRGRRRLVLGRDRLGKKPLYYAHDGDRLVFGSEIKAIIAADPLLAEPDDDCLLPYLRYGFVPEPRTFYRRIAAVPPGHVLVFERGRVSLREYWSPRPAALEGDDDHVEQLSALLADAVSSRLMSEVPLGLFLSGGLDSSAIVAFAAEASPTPLKTFTIGFDRPGWDESADAALVAAHFGTDHHTLVLSESEIERTLPDTLFDLTRHFDQPFADPSALPTYHVSKLAREHVTVILGGDGADELFAGYSTYRGVAFAERYRRLPGAAAGPALARRLARIVPRGRRYRLQHTAKVLSDSLLPFEALYLRKKMILRSSSLRQLLGPHSAPIVEASEPPAWITPELMGVLRSDLPWVDRMTYGDLSFGLLNDMLVKVDRMSMAHSLEMRSPFLDHRVVEFALGLPPERKLHRGTGKVALREAVRHRLPPATLRKRKQGFNVPLREWLRGGLAGLSNELLLGGRLLADDVFDRREVAALLRRHQDGEADHADAIWLLMSYAAWRELGARPSTSSLAA